MPKIPCVAVFDIGRTNKKFLLFDLSLHLLFQTSSIIPDITDEDGEPCEDIQAIVHWMKQTWQQVETQPEWEIQALNFSAHGAGLVHLNAKGKVISPLYAYVKPFPEEIKRRFFQTYGPEDELCLSTASPFLGMLNSGLQLYWLKYARPAIFQQISFSLHLPEYCSYVFTGRMCSQFTSIGCHTMMWDYERKDYHHWIKAEGLERLLPPITASRWNGFTRYRQGMIPVGTGLHDSSAALLAYMRMDTQPFLLLSTGTWGITLNPFARQLLTPEELQRDCLLYLLPPTDDEPLKVKASRYFLGYFHDQQIEKISTHFQVTVQEIFQQSEDLMQKHPRLLQDQQLTKVDFVKQPESLSAFTQAGMAYIAALSSLVKEQVNALRLAAEQATHLPKVYVDGGFAKNKVFMKLLQIHLPHTSFIATDIPDGSALGAACHVVEPLHREISLALNRYLSEER
ncbi:MAG: carbohydrate kinase [Thermoflavifilum sp.]|nr:carbohydrate kinase [Thermoflavifilum sp.]